MVVQASSTLTDIKTKVRRLTASSSTSTLSEASLEQYINTFYSQDFPYAIKTDQMRSVYTFYTTPYIDRYPLDVNYNQGIREPVYFEGIQGYFFKSRDEFFRMWPRWPTKFNPINGDGVTTSFTFTLPGPFLSKEVVIGGVDVNGTAISVNDDGNGNLLLQVPNPVTTVPQYYTPLPPTTASPIPGMHNQNNGNPGLNWVGTTTTPFSNAIGTVNYVTGAFSINFPVSPQSGSQMTCWVSQYQTGRPYCVMFWNNEFTVRPIPKEIHKVEVETYLTPVQFLNNSDNPIINQWWQYISYGVAMEILRDRQDVEGIENLREGFMRQEALVLERQGIEEINQRNSTLYSSTVTSQGNNNGFGMGWY